MQKVFCGTLLLIGRVAGYAGNGDGLNQNGMIITAELPGLFLGQ
jgi:hypothetical protein